ncbi:hypothetical protein ACFQ2B_01940 [Streptomyces stramineus]
MLRDRGGPHTVTGRDGAGRPASLVSDTRDDHWYWARAASPTGPGWRSSTPATPARAPARWTSPGAGTSWPGSPRPALSRPRSLTPLPSSARISWGAWLDRQSHYTYVYGTEKAAGPGNHLHLARVAGGDLRRPWRFRTAEGTWSPDERRAARLTGPGGAALLTSDELSVVRHGSWYALVTQRVDEPFSAETQIAWSRAPGGPYTRPRTVFTAPEAGPRGTYRNANVFAYNPHEHPELARAGELVLSYNVNSLVPDDVVRRADIYRPRFLRLTLTRPAR